LLRAKEPVEMRPKLDRFDLAIFSPDRQCDRLSMRLLNGAVEFRVVVKADIDPVHLRDDIVGLKRVRCTRQQILVDLLGIILALKSLKRRRRSDAQRKE
jgi:hypothetical protein